MSMLPNNTYNNYKPLCPQYGDVFTDTTTGFQEMWDGYAWIPYMAPTYTLNASGNHTHSIATTSWVSNQFKTTFNHSNGKDNMTVDDMIDFMKAMKKRMCIIDDALEKHDKYPALRQAYEDYKLIERLVCGDDTEE